MQAWRVAMQEVRRENLPLEVLSRVQLHRLNRSEKAASNSLPIHQRALRSVGRLMQSASGWLVRRPLNGLSHRRCLQPARRWLVTTRRRVVLWLAVAVIRQVNRKLQRSRGPRNS